MPEKLNHRLKLQSLGQVLKSMPKHSLGRTSQLNIFPAWKQETLDIRPADSPFILPYSSSSAESMLEKKKGKDFPCYTNAT